jgi:uncharacterized protein YecE (DUF72 family)
MARRSADPAQLDFITLRAPASAAPQRSAIGVEPAQVTADLRALAARLPASLRIGTSSWSFPGWKGIVYGASASKSQLARGGLQAYARHPLLRMAGIDRTYYAPLPASELASYAAVVSEDFRFLMKAHETCTVARFPNHPRYGDAGGSANALFLDSTYAADNVVAPFVEGLGLKGGPLLFQFAPQDLTAAGGPVRFIDRLHRFLDALPRGPLYAVELRETRLLSPAYRDVLAATGVSHCFNVHPTMPDIGIQADRVGMEFPAIVVRWMLGRGMAYEQARERYSPFDRLVDEDAMSRSAIATRCIAALRRNRPAFVVINNKAEGSAPLSAFALAHAIAALLEQDRGG